MKGLFAPIAYAPSISELTFASLRDAGVRGIIVDLDNTLVGFRGTNPEAREAEWIAAALEGDFAIVMLTNNASPWAREMARAFRVPIVANARKPLPHGFRRAVECLRLPRENVIVIGDQLFTDVLGARLAGLRVILVGPLAQTDPWNTWPLRFVERLILNRSRAASERKSEGS